MKSGSKSDSKSNSSPYGGYNSNSLGCLESPGIHIQYAGTIHPKSAKNACHLQLRCRAPPSTLRGHTDRTEEPGLPRPCFFPGLWPYVLQTGVQPRKACPANDVAAAQGAVPPRVPPSFLGCCVSRGPEDFGECRRS